MSLLSPQTRQAPRLRSSANDIRRDRREVAIVVGCIAVRFAVYLLAGVLGGVGRDVALYLYGGQRVLEAEPPYVGVRNRAGPVAHLLPGLGMLPGRLLGLEDDVVSPRVFYMLLAAIGVAAVYLLARHTFSSRSVGLVAAATLLASQGYAYLAIFGPREKTVMVVVVTLALLAGVHRRWLLAGALISVATLTWQPVFFPAIAAVVAMIVAGGAWSTWWRPIVRVAIGGAIPAGITVACYAAVDRLPLFLDWFVLVNAKYTDQPSLLSIGSSWESLVRGFGWSVWPLLLGSLAAVAGAVWAIRHRHTDDESRRRTSGLVAAGVYVPVGVFWCFKAFDGWADALVLLPAASIGVAWVADLAIRRIPRARRIGVVAAITACCIIATGLYAMEHRSTRLDGQRDAVAEVFDVVPDATLMTLETPLPSVLSRTQNPARIQIFSNGIMEFLDHDWNGGVDGYARWLVDHDTTLVATRGNDVEWLEPVLEERYHRAGIGDTWTWWVNHKVDDDTQAAIAEAVTNSPTA